MVRVKVPRSSGSVLSILKLEFLTPCGPKLALAKIAQSPADEQQMLGNGASPYLQLTEENVLPFVDVWLDADAGENVRLGGAQLRVGRTRVFDPGCRPTSPVQAGDRELGTFSAPADTSESAVFITTRSDACYRYQRVLYAKNPDPKKAGPAAVYLPRAQVHQLPSADWITNFLEPVPSVLYGARGNAGQTTELVKVDCR